MSYLDVEDVAATLLHGFGHPVAIVLDRTSPAIGRSLAQVAVRGLTGATVLAIARDGETFVPDPHDELRAGDVLAVAGRADAITAASALLLGEPT